MREEKLRSSYTMAVVLIARQLSCCILLYFRHLCRISKYKIQTTEIEDCDEFRLSFIIFDRQIRTKMPSKKKKLPGVGAECLSVRDREEKNQMGVRTGRIRAKEARKQIILADQILVEAQKEAATAQNCSPPSTQEIFSGRSR